MIAKRHHILAWLNGVKTMDMVHDAGFRRWKCWIPGSTAESGTKTVSVNTLYIQEMSDN